MICRGRGCSNNTKKGWCEICQLQWACNESGYTIDAEIKDGKIYGIVLRGAKF